MKLPNDCLFTDLREKRKENSVGGSQIVLINICQIYEPPQMVPMLLQKKRRYQSNVTNKSPKTPTNLERVFLPKLL